MWINRDISEFIDKDTSSFIQILIGPRQCGKSSLLWFLGNNEYSEVTFDDFQERELAQKDPAFFLAQQKLPLIIDEVQYAPNIFPQLKIHVDKIKRTSLQGLDVDLKKNRIRLTGSNQILLDKRIKESLVGRARYFYLNTLSVNEICNALPGTELSEIIYNGGWPELYRVKELNTVTYLNDYIRNYIEKDLVIETGISKIREFYTVIGLLAGRTGQLLSYTDIAKDSGVKSVTVKEWVSILEYSNIVYLLQPYFTNLNKRLTRTPKIYFYDTGLACRLQGWQNVGPLLKSPQAGHLFETLVLGEIIKYKNNFQRNFKIYLWRTKEGEEIDFVIETEDNRIYALEVKLGIHGVQAESLPTSFSKTFKSVKQLILVSSGGKRQNPGRDCIVVPVFELVNYFKENRI